MGVVMPSVSQVVHLTSGKRRYRTSEARLETKQPTLAATPKCRDKRQQSDQRRMEMKKVLFRQY